MNSSVFTPLELSEQGRTAYQNRDFEAAGRAYLAAMQAYQTAGDGLTAAEMANNSSVAWLQAGEAAQALQVVTGTADVFAAAGDLRRQAMSIGNAAAALEELRRYPEALELYQKSADLLLQVGDGETRAYVMQAISKIYFRTGRQFEALAAMEAGLAGLPKPTLKQRLLKRMMKLPLRSLGMR